MKLKKVVKQVVIGAVTLSILLGNGLAVCAASGKWVKEDAGWRYQESTGNYLAKTWVHDGKAWFYIGESSYMRTGWFQDTNGTWYYLYPDASGSQGAMSTGWILDNDTWYFADSSGAMQTGVIMVDGKTYYLNPVSDGTKGAMQTDTVTINGIKYNFNSSGAAIGGSIPTAAKKFNSNGGSVATSTSSSGGSSGSSSSSSISKGNEYKRATSAIKRVKIFIDDDYRNPDLTVKYSGIYNTVKIIVTSTNPSATVGDTFTEALANDIVPLFQVGTKLSFTIGGVVNIDLTVDDVRSLFSSWVAANDSKALSDLAGKTYQIKATFSDNSIANYIVTMK